MKLQEARTKTASFDYSPDDMPRREDMPGVCATDPNPGFWFPEDYSYGAKQKVTEYAKAGCARCPVRDACLSLSLKNGEQFGIWGGLTATARGKLMKGNAA